MKPKLGLSVISTTLCYNFISNTRNKNQIYIYVYINKYLRNMQNRNDTLRCASVVVIFSCSELL